MSSADRSRVIVVQFGGVDTLAAAMRDARASGWQCHEYFTPFPIEPPNGDDLLRDQSPLPKYGLAGGVIGGVGSALLQWWTMARAYPLDIGGRPRLAIPAFVPIVFESTVLGAAMAIVVGWLVISGLPRLWHPIDDAPGFETASRGSFWLMLEPPAGVTPETAQQFMIARGGSRVSWLTGAA